MASYITPALFAFLTDLKAHNDRDWFNQHKPRYEAHVKQPLLAFIEAFEAPLHAISPHFLATPRSLFRIYRDTRFSKNKDPYKTVAGIHFRHAQVSKDVHAPGFYLHLEPGQVFAGLGIWHPPTAALTPIREAIVNQPDRWRTVRDDPAFAQTFDTSHGDTLKRAPKGFDPDHPLIDDLKRKDFVASCAFADADACAPDFPQRLAETYQSGAPFMQFLTVALDLPWE